MNNATNVYTTVKFCGPKIDQVIQSGRGDDLTPAKMGYYEYLNFPDSQEQFREVFGENLILFQHAVPVIIVKMVPKILNKLSENVQIDINLIFSFIYSGNNIWEVIPKISQGKLSITFVKTYPTSDKNTMTKWGNKRLPR